MPFGVTKKCEDQPSLENGVNHPLWPYTNSALWLVLDGLPLAYCMEQHFNLQMDYMCDGGVEGQRSLSQFKGLFLPLFCNVSAQIANNPAACLLTPTMPSPA